MTVVGICKQGCMATKICECATVRCLRHVVLSREKVAKGVSVYLLPHSTPDTAQDEEPLEGRQQVQAMRQLHLVGLWAVVQGPPLLGSRHERLGQSLHTHDWLQLPQSSSHFDC